MKFKITSTIALIMLLLTSWKSAFAQVADVSEETFPMFIDGYTVKIPVYSNFDIFEEHDSIDKAVIIIQGSNRNAGPYLDNMSIAAFNAATNTTNTLLVAPQFLIEEDIDFHSLDPQHLYWSNGGWKSGSKSLNEPTNPRPVRIPSYAVLDRLLFHLANQFPHLSSIVFTGHSAGGQVTHRMAASSPITDILCSNYGIHMRYVVINPSSYVYMDGQRRISGTVNEFAIPDNSCVQYNEWKYGLDDLYTYQSPIGADSIRNMLRRRTVSYLVGEDDNDASSSSLDHSCQAELQGSQRLERGEIFYNYLQHYYGNEITTNQEFTPVPNVGHNSLNMWNSDEGRWVIFDKPINNCATAVGTKEQLSSFKVDISPNPAQEILRISCHHSARQNAQATMFDFQGRLLFTKSINAQDELALSALNNGIYLLLIQIDGNSVYKKIMVQR